MAQNILGLAIRHHNRTSASIANLAFPARPELDTQPLRRIKVVLIYRRTGNLVLCSACPVTPR
jgi:hypothetical protein